MSRPRLRGVGLVLSRSHFQLWILPARCREMNLTFPIFNRKMDKRSFLNAEIYLCNLPTLSTVRKNKRWNFSFVLICLLFFYILSFKKKGSNLETSINFGGVLRLKELSYRPQIGRILKS